MTPRLKPLAEQVIVVTGASSGIGLITARMAAAQGARVVLAARSGPILDKAVADIAAGGGEALAVTADVSRREDVERIARRAVERFGRIDTWVNNAGVGIWGVLEEVSEADMRRLFDTNLWGVVNGSLVAIPHLEAAGGGALINIGSALADRAAPLQGIYSASKHAVKGFTDALRIELGHRGAPVAVTLVKPWSVGTPLPDHVRNYTGRQAELPPPVLDPEAVARTILHAAEHRTREVFVGSMGAVAAGIANVAPRLLDRVSEGVLFELQLGREIGTTSGNLWQSSNDGRVRRKERSGEPRPLRLAAAVPSLPLVPALVVGAVVTSLGLLLLRRR